MPEALGIAVIGAGMAGKAHAAAYRVAPTLYDSVLPPLRFVSIADVNTELGAATATRYGYERADTSWQAVAEADDIDVVSVVIANKLHREVVEGLLAAGKHVLCEKPLSDTLEDARAMAAAAASASTVARIGFTYRRAPGIAAIRDMILDGTLGRVLHFRGSYLCDYSCSPQAPWSWRYQGAPGSGALADVGSHMAYIAESLAGDITGVSGGALSTVITQRPMPLGAVVGHEHGAVSNEYRPVTNDDYAAFTAHFGDTVGMVEASRVAAGHPNGLSFEVYCENGAATFYQGRPGQIELYLHSGPNRTNGYRTVIAGPELPYLAAGVPMDAQGVGFGQNDYFAYQARALLDEVAGIPESASLPRNASFDEGVHNMEILAAVAESAANDGKKVTL